MAPEPAPAPTAFEAAAHETLVASLRNAHALEKQAITVLETQLKILTDYPELHARLTEHIVATRDQARRLEAGLEACGGSTSMVKDALLSVMGLGQSSVQGFSDDAVLKAVAADMMTEHLEIATYRMLIALADMAGKPELKPRLQETLREEEAMAEWFEQNLEAITRRYVEILASDKKEVDEAPRQQVATPDGQAAPTLWQTLEAGGEVRANPGSDDDAKSRPMAAANPSLNPGTKPARPREPDAPTVRAGHSRD
jgi:ferritin-like metal-binding protein YciE